MLGRRFARGKRFKVGMRNVKKWEDVREVLHNGYIKLGGRAVDPSKRCLITI